MVKKKEIYIIYDCLNTGIHIHAYHTAGYLTGFYFLKNYFFIKPTPGNDYVQENDPSLIKREVMHSLFFN